MWLAQGLVELGHEVSVLALRGSSCRYGRVVPLDRADVRTPGFDLTPVVPAGADLVHLHAPLARAPGLPHLFTWHGNARHGERLPTHVVFLSASHARRHGRATNVYNGLDPAEYRFRARKAGFDLFLGRLHRAKGYRWAIEGARRSGRRLRLAGGWRPSFRPDVRYVGSVGGERKAELLSSASCLWMPALWDEPFGLTLIEAMASGTPVLGTRRGALPEIESGEVGLLGDTVDELVTLRDGIDRIDPAACRARVERHFTHRVMAEEYLRIFGNLLETGELPRAPTSPTAPAPPPRS
jgi:glycosyltransferase involved in cell wall biosynthesis